MKNQRCSSCNRRAPRITDDFSIWNLLCSKCAKGLKEALEEHWFDHWIPKVEEVLDAKYMEKWKKLDKKVQIGFIMECIEQRVIKINI